ncbi:bacillithiol biosynthesis cysteine-adding enzyme BshC [Acidobacteria bacterium AB60]|nr:bacillithiol biosynthesis cysteine-adding enzyme BshC [Acidobacteria bacterium AB60]
MPTAECYPISVVPGLSRLYLDFCAGAPAVREFYGRSFADPWRSEGRPRLAHREKLAAILAEQNPVAAEKLGALRGGAGTVLTGQQVSLFGGPLFTPFKAATALARAQQATEAGDEHVAIFWLASEDHDFAEVQTVAFPARRELRRLKYESAPPENSPVGGLVLDDTINALLEQAGELIGYSDALEALNEAYRPGRTLAQAFGDFYRKVFAAQGLLVFDAAGRDVHALGAPVLREAIQRADEFNARLLARDEELTKAGYHAQVAVAPNSSLLFLMDEKTGARVALKRLPQSAAEPDGLWQAGRQRLSSSDLEGILAAEPERISPSALLRPVFQDYLFGTSLTIGGPAEVAYFAQSAVLFEQILGRMTPVHPRFTATIVEPDIGELLRRHELTVERILEETPDSLAPLLAARAMPVEGKRKLASAGNALDAELTELLGWMRATNEELGRSGETAARKMRYQMNRLRRLTANFVLQREESLTRHAQAITTAVFPEGHLQERVHGAAWYFARHGFAFAEELVQHAAKDCPGHSVLWV